MNKLTLGIFAHANAGKTTLTEHLLFHTNVISTVGRVDTGTTVTDSMKIEQERGITIRSSVVTFDLGDLTVQLIDTPGHVDFYAEVERAVNTLDGAILVLSGVEGVEAQTYSIWRQLKEKKIPTIIYVNKMDRHGADYHRILQDLYSKLGARVIPLKNVLVDNGGLQIHDIPLEELLEYLLDYEVDFIKDNLDRIASISVEEVHNELYDLSKSGSIVCVVGGSALKDIGILDVLYCIEKCLPHYQRQCSDSFRGYVFALRYINGRKRAYIKVLDGCLSIKDSIKIDDEKEIKVSALSIPIGNRLVSVEQVAAGDIAVLENSSLICGQIIGDLRSMNDFKMDLNPVLDMQVLSGESQSEDVVKALNILNEEDPYLNVRYSPNTMKMCVSLMGEVQGQVVEQMIFERFGLKISLQNPTLIHKETPSKEAVATAYYTRVSGIEMKVTPLPRGSGLVYKSKVSTDILHKKYQRQSERLIMQYIKQGVFGWEVTDAEINIIDGRFDSLGSEPKHFNIAVPLALMRALKASNPIVLEPVSEYTIVFPDSFSSIVIQYVSGLNGVYNIAYTPNNTISISGEASTRNLANAPLTIAKLTSGRGIFYSKVTKYQESYNNQVVENNFYGPDPRNEVTFVINDMNAGLDSLDPVMTKRKKESKSKYKRVQREKEIRTLKAKGEL